MSTSRNIDMRGFILSDSCKPPRNSLVGLKSGRLLVVDFYGRKNGKSYYRCLCDCGNEAVVYGNSIFIGKTKSCGCYHADKNKEVHSIDITGKRWGRLVALKFFKRKNKRTFWTMQCDCGNIKNIAYENLLSGNVNSCGCIKKELMSSKRGENCHLWRGGRSLYYPKEWTENLKERIRNRDNRKCQYPECDYTDSFGEKKLDVHHIDEDKNNCNEYNLISLCHAHHKTVQLSNNEWINYFYNITESYL